MATKSTKKAEPTKVVSENRDNSLKFYSALFVAAIIVCAGTVFLGKSDVGVINVTAAINNANEQRRAANSDPANENNKVEEVPNTREIHRKLRNGGLVPTETQQQETTPVPQPEEETASEDIANDGAETEEEIDNTDTSTDETAEGEEPQDSEEGSEEPTTETAN